MQILLCNRERTTRMIMESDGAGYDHTFGSKKERGIVVCSNISFRVPIIVIFIVLVALQRRRIWRITLICNRTLGPHGFYKREKC